MLLHIDMDAFYASIEQRDRPELRGQPVIVGAPPERRGVVCAASYEARKYGVHSAMPSATAHRLCPQGVFLSPRIDYYVEVSNQIQAIFERYTPLMEPLSLDEAFLDVRGSVGLFGPPEQIARRIKEDIRRELELVASVGAAPNKFLAKVASDLGKPDGFVVVDPVRVQEFLDPLPVGRLWGVGRVSNQRLEALGIRTIAQLRRLTPEFLAEQFGSGGEHLWELAHGRDDRSVTPDREAQSISRETTFPADLSDAEVLRAWLLDLTDQVARRLRRHELTGRTVHVKIRLADFRLVTGSQTLAAPSDVTDELWQAAETLLARRWTAQRPPVRLLGMGVSGLESKGLRQRMLFDEPLRQRDERLDAATDAIRDRYGEAAIGRAQSLKTDGE